MKWKLGLAQHPMYLLIREDTQCAERTPPWGAPNIESYIDRVRRNLGALRRYPRLKLGYEWSAAELELLNQDAPDALERMRDYARKGRVQFYNGTYAQPHLQILSSESNLRQLEYGLETYRELGLGTPRSYVHQEASVHDQVPQLLRAFGIEFAAVPGFLSTLAWLDEAELVLHGVRGPRFVEGTEFAAWQGLDGTQIPLYLHQPIPREMSLEETLGREQVLGLLRVPPVLIDMPDMIDIDPQWMDERRAVEFVLLDEAFEQRLQEAPPRARARLYTHWSYLQGIRAEELARANFQAERSVLRAEALQALAFTVLGRSPSLLGIAPGVPGRAPSVLDRAPASTRALWKTVLTCQHHDVYCFCAPELRGKAIGWLMEAEKQAARLVQEACKAVAESVDTGQINGQAVVLFNSLPHPVAEIAEIAAPAGISGAVDYQGNPIPVEATPMEDGSTLLRFPVRLAGLGYTTYALHSGGESGSWGEIGEPFEFENRFLRASLSPQGVFQSLKLQPEGFELLDGGRGGNRLTATDSQSISLKQENTQERLARLNFDPPVRGPELHWEAVSPPRLLRSPLGASLEVFGRLGERVSAHLLVRFYNDLPRIDLAWTFDFRQASIGTFFDDDSKLCVRWPLESNTEIHHDIPFGAVKTMPERPFFPTSWVDFSDGRRGVAFFHQGASKHWVTDHTLLNLLAWGEDTDAIHNGLGRDRWLKSFDQRLDGRHRIESALYVHRGDWRTGAVAQAALAYRFPPVAFHTGAHPGALPLEADILHLEEPGLVSTAVFNRGGRVVCRVYAAGEQPADGSAALNGLRRVGYHTLAGQETFSLAPFQIGEIEFDRTEEKTKMNR